jgi:multicomponent Na+:H+ antiporter subunit B
MQAMIKRIIVLAALILFLVLFLGRVSGVDTPQSLSGVGAGYVDRSLEELNSPNVVTAIVVTYRGIDTLGEVSVLFLAAAAVSLLLRIMDKGSEETRSPSKRPSSEILSTGTDLLVPVIVFFGVYIFLNGHLSPGGGFQGGAVVASAVLLLLLAYPEFRLRHGILAVLESISGSVYVMIAVLGLILASGFLDSRLLALGETGRIISAGTIPLIYTVIGLKVGTELAGIIENLGGDR